MTWVHYQDRDMKAKVDGDLARARRTVYLIIPKFFMAVTATSIYFWGPEPYSTLAMIFISLVLGVWPMQAIRRQQAYTRGWHDGRRLAFLALREANDRHMDLEDWLSGEMERDMRTLL